MAGQTKLETHPYLLIITRYGGSEILLPSATRSLPSLDVALRERPAEQLVTGVQQEYRLETYCLWFSYRGASGGDGAPVSYAVLEMLDQNQPAPKGMRWESARDAESRVGSDAGTAIRSFIDDLGRYRTDPKSSFAKPGWVQELFSWARGQLAPLGLRLTGGFWQLNASPAFSLLRLQTNRAAVWFKATGEPNAHELPVSLAIAQLMPEYVPRILGVHPQWNGWLSLHAPGKLLREVDDRSAWETAARTLARLQIRSLQKGDPLRESGVRDLGIRTLAERIEPFIDCVSRLMEAQEKPTPAPLTKSELSTVREQLGEAFERLEELKAIDSIGCFDVNPGNIIVSRDRAVFLDWAETYWGHPFFSFAYLVEHFRRHFSDASFESALGSSYAEPWLAVCGAEKVAEALVIAPLVAAFAYTVEGRSWQEPDALQDPRVAGQLRSMARRMYRDARQLEQGSQTCLS